MSHFFDQDSIEKNIVNLQDIYVAMAAYYEAVEFSRTQLLDEVFHKDWLMKDTDNPGAQFLNVEDKRAFIKRVADHGPYPDYGKDRMIVNIETAYNQLAFVRVNKDSSCSSTCFFLFKTDGNWQIVDKIWVNPRSEFNNDTGSKESMQVVIQLVKDYVKAIQEWDKEVLNALLHEKWDLKYIMDGNLNIVAKQEYLCMPDIYRQKKCIDFSRLLSVDIYQDSMAIIRIDRPDERETIFLAFFKIDNEWRIVNERKSNHKINQVS